MPFDDIINWDEAVLRKISVNLGGHATSFSIENPFLEILQMEARERKIAFAQFVRQVDEQRPAAINLSSALRLMALAILKKNSTPI